MSHAPRDYQTDLINGVYAAWSGGARNLQCLPAAVNLSKNNRLLP